MSELSSAAQAVITASNCAGSRIVQLHIAAALRAAADQVVPEQLEPPCGEAEPWPQGYQLMRDAQWEKCQQLRSEILAIAAELEAQ